MGNTCKGSKQSIQRRFSRIESYSNAWTQYGYFDISHLLNQCSEVKLSVYTSKQFLFQSFWPEISQEISSSPSETRTPALKKLIRK